MVAAVGPKSFDIPSISSSPLPMEEDLSFLFAKVHALIKDQPFVISADKVKKLKDLTGWETTKLLQHLVTIIKPFARPAISQYHVGAAGLSSSGAIYLGVNLEFKGFPLNNSIHAEQFLLINLRNHGEIGLLEMAVSAAPCGHCRQFLNEIGEDIIISFGPETTSLSTLLPFPFGPKDLGLTGGILTRTEPTSPVLKSVMSLDTLARSAALQSYTPYTHAFSGVALETDDGEVYQGSYLENAAFNPSLSPLHSALVAVVCEQKEYGTITEACFVESTSASTSQLVPLKAILHSIAPEVKIDVQKVDELA